MRDTYGSVHVQELLVFVELQPNPGRVFVAVAVPLCQNLGRLLTVVVHIQPTRRLRNDPYEQGN